MSRHYRAYVPEQTLLMPPSLRDWLAEDHLAYFISDAVDAMDLSAFDQRYGDSGPGNQAFDPRMMVKVLIYGYATGVFSSRKIAVKLSEDVAFRVLGADNFPAHRTIADFRKLHLKAFRELFVQVVLMAREAGLVKLGTVAIDGTKVRANASKRKAMSYDRMKAEEKRLREEVRELVNQAKRTDAEEDQRYGTDRRGDELPDELATREKRLATIQAAMKRLEERQRAAAGSGTGSARVFLSGARAKDRAFPRVRRQLYAPDGTPGPVEAGRASPGIDRERPAELGTGNSQARDREASAPHVGPASPPDHSEPASSPEAVPAHEPDVGGPVSGDGLFAFRRRGLRRGFADTRVGRRGGHRAGPPGGHRGRSETAPSDQFLQSCRGRCRTSDCYVVTVYVPEAETWSDDFRTRRKQ